MPITAEILQPDSVKLAMYASDVGDDGLVEIVSSQYIASNLLAQAAVTPGLTKIYEDLLTFGENSNEIYNCKISSKYVGKRVDEFFRHILNLRENNINIIPIAISRGKKIYINPSKTDINSIEGEDVLFAICDKREDLNSITL